MVLYKWVFLGTVKIHNKYTIANSTFQYNSAGKCVTSPLNVYKSYFCERGGGVHIVVFDNVLRNSNITLFNNTLEGNSAVFGGGALVCLSGSTSGNTIQILHNKFIANRALAGGGGLDVGITTHNKPYPRENFIFVFNSSFEHNKALFGGGMSMFGGFISFFKKHTYNEINCSSCHFESNTARGGAAVNIGPDIFKFDGTQCLMLINFVNCTIENNSITFDSTSSGASDGNGAFFTSVIAVKFSGKTIFTGNNGTALYIDSTIAIFGQNSFVDFSNNSGYQGGGILLFGKSALYVGEGGYFQFSNNTATKFGGAICALNGGKHVFPYINLCFLKLKNPHSKLTGLNFIFVNNSAKIGDDIYATSIVSCEMLCRRRSAANSLTHFFDNKCFGNFKFGDSQDHITKHVATSPMNVTSISENSSLAMPIFPGILTHLNIVQYDEVGGDVSQLFPLTARVQSSSQNASIKVDSSYTVITDNSVILFGSPGDKGDLLLESQTVRHFIRFKLSHCGPGFVLNKGKDTKCVCSSFNSNNESLSYVSLKCEPNGSVGIAVNNWAGYPNISIASPDSLYTGVCVTQLCNHCPTNDTSDYLFCSLPQSPENLEKQICGESRQGRLCGRCVPYKSVYYHSDNFTCGDNTSCQYGIPIYIASELLPVTIIFLVILLFKISLTSGAVYSFVFYAQILSILSITLYGTIPLQNKNTAYAIKFFQLLLGIFNFNIGKWEFCVFQTDSIMNLLMIKYATLAYAFFLVLATILIMRIHSCYSCVKVCRRCGRRNIRGSIVDGLSAFLVLCYFQCAVVTSQILTPSQLFGINKTWNTTVALFDGELDYLKGAHLWYALPAFLCMIFILIPPPTILILEPILTKLFSMDCFTSTPPKWYYNRLRLKLMPFLDSFQACFKDRHRYFAGLYFLYRLVIPLTSIFVQSIQNYYASVTCLFLVILLIHTLLQPYKKKWHSLLERSLFINIIMLFAISIYNYTCSRNALIYVQLLFISLSCAYIVLYTIFEIQQKFVVMQWWKKWIWPTASRESTEVEADSLPYRLLINNNDVTISDSYRTF